MKPEETIDFHIRWAWHSIARLYNNEAAKHNMSMSTGYVLLSIDMEKGTPSTQLGPKMGMEARSLTRTIKNMEKQGLIRRKADKVDKRRVQICLTAKGKRSREIAKNAVLHFNEKVQSQIPKNELKGFFKVMNRINNIMNEPIFETEEK